MDTAGCIYNFLSILFYVLLVFSLHVCVSCTCLVPVEARRWQWIPWNWRYRYLWAMMWVLRIKPRFSVRAKVFQTAEPCLQPSEWACLHFTFILRQSPWEASRVMMLPLHITGISLFKAGSASNSFDKLVDNLIIASFQIFFLLVASKIHKFTLSPSLLPAVPFPALL